MLDENGNWQLFVEDNAKAWLNAVSMQAERCFAAMRKLSLEVKYASQNRGEFQKEFDQIHQASDQMRIEEHFFVIALGKAIDWLNELGQQKPTLQTSISNYITNLPHAIDVRNMREHDIEYLKGQGHKQDNFLYQHTDESNQADGISDATATMVLGKDYLIGGRINVTNASQISKELLLLLWPPIT